VREIDVEGEFTQADAQLTDGSPERQGEMTGSLRAVVQSYSLFTDRKEP
jgi:hypothetical protein